MRLSERGFECSAGAACESGRFEPSHVLVACGYERKVAFGSLRVSLGRSTTKPQLERFVRVLAEEVKKLSSRGLGNRATSRI